MSLVLFKVYQLHSDFLEIFKVYGIAHSPNLIFFCKHVKEQMIITSKEIVSVMEITISLRAMHTVFYVYNKDYFW